MYHTVLRASAIVWFLFCFPLYLFLLDSTYSLKSSFCPLVFLLSPVFLPLSVPSFSFDNNLPSFFDHLCPSCSSSSCLLSSLQVSSLLGDPSRLLMQKALSLRPPGLVPLGKGLLGNAPTGKQGRVSLLWPCQMIWFNYCKQMRLHWHNWPLLCRTHHICLTHLSFTI